MGTKREYVKNVFFLYSSKIIMVLSTFAYTYLIANYLGPAKYGIFNYYVTFATGILGIFGVHVLHSVVTTFLPKYKSEGLFRRIIKVHVGLLILPVIVLLFFSEEIDAFLDKGNYLFLKYTVFFIIVFSFYELYKYFFQSFKLFGKVLKTEAVVNTANLVLAFILVILLKQDIFGALYAKTLSVMLGMLLFLYFYGTLRFLNLRVDYGEIKKFGKYAVSITLTRRIYSQVYLVLLGFFIVNVNLGLYYIAEKIVLAFLGIPASTLTDVSRPYLAERYKNKASLAKILSLNIKALIVFMLFFGFFLSTISKWLLGIFFPEYVEAYKYVPFFVLISVINSIGLAEGVFAVLNKMDLLLRIFIFRIITLPTVGLLLIPRFDVFGVLTTNLIIAIITAILYIYYLGKIGIKLDIVPKRKDVYSSWHIIRDRLRNI